MLLARAQRPAGLDELDGESLPTDGKASGPSDEFADLNDFTTCTAGLSISEQHRKHKAWRLKKRWNFKSIQDEWKSLPSHLAAISKKAVRKEQFLKRKEVAKARQKKKL